MTLEAPAARILVIEDNPQELHILMARLRIEGYEVLGALTSDEGLRLFDATHPDLVLLDIALPGEIDGLELLKRMRTSTPSSKVIMVTGNTHPLVARQTLQLGAIAYVDKPFDFAYLKRVVAMALRETRGSGSWRE